MGFASNVTAWVDALRKRVEEMPAAITYELARVAIEHTPVDTGALRGNWTVRINHADADFRPRATDKNGHVALGALRATLETARPGDVIYLLNPTPYAHFLEFGTSMIEARPMVAPTQAAFPDILAKVLTRR